MDVNMPGQEDATKKISAVLNFFSKKADPFSEIGVIKAKDEVMTKIDYSKLFSYINREVDQETRKEVECWRKADVCHEAFYKRVRDYYHADPTANKKFTTEELDSLFEAMLKEKRSRRRIAFQQRMAVAASIVALLAVGTWFITSRLTEKRTLPIVQAEKAIPENGIIVITESGQKFTPEQLNVHDIACEVSAGQLAYSDAQRTLPADTAGCPIPMHTIVVPRGTTYKLRLADGSRVLLSPASELTYPVRFDSLSPREVTLKGEAFFEVAKADNRFIVHTQQSQVQVYGTIFNVLARNGKADETVLLEGSVGVTPKVAHGRETLLRPGECSWVDSAGQVTVAAADLAVYTAKRNGYLLFNGKTVREILRELELYYDVAFVEESALTNQRAYVLSFKLDEPLRDALDVLKAVADVQFTIQGKEVYVKAK